MASSVSDGFTRVGARASVTAGKPLIVRQGRYEVAIFEVAGALYAYENACPHQGGPIGEGWVEGTVVTCPWHAWRFELTTGAMTLGNFACLRRFAVREADGAIYLACAPEEES